MQYEQKRVTASGKIPTEPFESPVPNKEKLADGQHVDHWVLSESERAKGFVRPVRKSYKHVGPPKPQYPIRDLTPEESERFANFGYEKYEKYPDNHTSSAVGRFWTKVELEKHGCGVVTTMGSKIAETYAAQPHFYGNTFCSGCGDYFPVGEFGEFVWADAPNERVGT